MTRADVLVVGAGAAGCVLAARLSEDPARRVLVLEAGPAPASLAEWPPALLDATRIPGADPSDPFDQWYPSELRTGRAWDVVRGRVAGGSTAVNGGYFVRPRRADLERWSAHGEAAWSWEAALPLLRGLERDLDLDGPLHGATGPIPVHREPLAHPAAAAFVDAALDAGHPLEPDKNGEQPAGVGAMPSNAVAGVRWNAALTHLLPASGRPNLRVVGGARVARVVVRGGRAVGVEAVVHGRLEVVEADRVVLSAGALSSPAILLRSGIGPAEELRALGVPVAVDAAVGRGFSDHPQIALGWSPVRPLPRPESTWAGALLAAGGPDGDVEVLQSLRPLGPRDRDLAGTSPLPVLVSANAPVPTGELDLVSADPGVPPRIRFRYLSSDLDRRRMRTAVGTAREVLLGSALAALGRLETVPTTADELDDWIAGRIGTALHTCGTVPFRLPDGTPGPVTPDGGVRGVDALHVADTSILPDAPSRGPAATAALVGEIVARAVRAAA